MDCTATVHHLFTIDTASIITTYTDGHRVYGNWILTHHTPLGDVTWSGITISDLLAVRDRIVSS